jgi:DNA-binding CsgD family transcriptional regulator
MWRVQALTVIARAQNRLGDGSAATSAIHDAVQIARAGHVTVGSDVALAVAAHHAFLQGDSSRADALAREALELELRTGMFCAAADLLDLLSALAHQHGNDVLAARLRGASDQHRQVAGVGGRWTDPLPPAHDTVGSPNAKAVRAAWEEGRSLTVESAIGLVMRGRGRRRARGSSGWPSLTEAELRVVDLTAEGLSNADIAKRLFISPRTVETHLAHVYAKLDISTRSELIAEAFRRAHT